MDETSVEKSNSSTPIEPNPQAREVPTPEPEFEHVPLKQIRTFQGDVAEALRNQNESLVSIQRAEQVKILQNPVAQASSRMSLESVKRKRDAIFFIVGSIVLLALGATGAWFAYQGFINQTRTETISGPVSKFINTGSNAEVLAASTTARDTLTRLIGEASDGVPVGDIRHIAINAVAGSDNSALTAEGFFKVLNANTPGSLVRAFEPYFMLGALGSGSSTTPESNFLIFKLASFENAYAGMLLWEKDMAKDIAAIFSSAVYINSVPPGTVFVDITDKNKDIRALTLEGMPVLLYSFYDSRMLVVTDRIETMRIILDRLSREKLSR